MKIQCTLKHFRGMTINVNGNSYVVDENLCIDTKTDADAEKLLAGKSWTANVLEHGHRVYKPKPKPAVAPAKDPEPPPTQDVLPPVEEEEETAEGPVDTDGNPLEEWPDPTEDMDPDYLRKIADAYQVSYKKNTGAKTLVKKITEAMYG